MADAQFTYFIDSSGQTQKIPLAEAGNAAQLGWTPASKEQVSSLKLEEKFGTTGQQLKTFAEGAGQTLTFGGSTWAEKALGVPVENIEGRAHVNPGVRLAGELTGVAVPAAASMGAAALPESGALGLAKAATSWTAPSLIARAGEGAAALLPEAAASGLGRIGLAAAKGAVSAGTEGGFYGLSHVVHEAALGDPNLTWQSAAEEVGLSGLLGGGIGATGGVLSGLTHEALGSELGEKLSKWSNTFEGNQNIKSAAGPGKGQVALRGLYKKMSPEQAAKLGQESGEMGLVTPWTKPADTYERAQAVLDDVGPKLGDGLKAIDASSTAPRPEIDSVVEKMRKEVLVPLQSDPASQSAANTVKRFIREYQNTLETDASKAAREADVAAKWAERTGKGLSVDEGYAGGPQTTSLSTLHDARAALSKSIYGLRGDLSVSNATKLGLSELRGILSDEIEAGIERSGGDLGAWRALNRQYHVASTISNIAERGMASAGLSGVPLTALISGAAGLVSGGPLGAAALGAGAMLAKRYGPGILAAGARGVRRLVDEGGAEALINKTADLIASERQAATGEAAAAGAAGAGRLARAFDIASEKLEPAIAPVKDAARDVAQEKVGRVERGASSAPETVAALSQLEKARASVDARVNALAKHLVSGSAGTVASEKVAAKDDNHIPLDRIHQLANNPDLMQQQISKATAELDAHAPGVAQAAAIHMSKAVSFLNAKYPPMPKMGPLGPVLKMPKSQIFQMHKTQSVINKPTLLLKHAANYQLTPDLVAAVQATAPERLAQMQQAVLQHVAEHQDPVPYKGRQQIGILMGRDMDGSSTPQAIQAAQLAYAMPSAKSPENQAPAGRSTQTGLGKLNLAGNMRLPGQAAESRRRSDA